MRFFDLLLPRYAEHEPQRHDERPTDETMNLSERCGELTDKPVLASLFKPRRTRPFPLIGEAHSSETGSLRC